MRTNPAAPVVVGVGFDGWENNSKVAARVHRMAGVVSFGKEALDFAKRYVALVDALRAQGVEEQTAREEARAAAVMLMFQAEMREEGEGSCPLCGREK